MYYRNGELPRGLFTLIAAGYDEDGYWEHLLTPSTLAKWNALIERGKQYKGRGRVLALSSGYSGYRPLAPQIAYRERYGRGAAVPGASSHGGFWEGSQCLAMDIGNWAWVYDGSRDAFYADCRAVGLAPGLISEGRGYPDEPWHVIDFTPFAPVFAGTGGSSGTTSRPKQTEEDESMRYLFIREDNSGQPAWCLLNTRTGKYIVTHKQRDADGWAKAWGSAHELPLQDFLNAIDAIKKTS